MADNPLRQSGNGTEYQYGFYHTESVGMSGGFIINLSVGSTEKQFDNDDRWAIHKQMEEIQKILQGRIYNADPKTAEQAAEQKQNILECFASALPIYVEEIPNEYCSDFCHTLFPWFIVTTARGRIKVGWRKRVINLDWSGSEISTKADDLFESEDVTKGDRYIHCYGYESLKRHIEALMKSE